MLKPALVWSLLWPQCTDMLLNILAFWYQVIVASEPLLEEAIYLLGDGDEEGELKAFYRKHLEDERKHAQWLKEDLGDHPINLHFGAAQLAGMAYYLIRHVHPVALLGYMQALEGRRIPDWFVDQVEAEHGSAAVRTLRIHAEADRDHIVELEAFSLPDEWRDLVAGVRAQTEALVESIK